MFCWSPYRGFGTSSGLGAPPPLGHDDIVHGKGMIGIILHDTSFVLVPRDGRLVCWNDSLVSRGLIDVKG